HQSDFFEFIHDALVSLLSQRRAKCASGSRALAERMYTGLRSHAMASGAKSPGTRESERRG
ncbi:MAG: hypothetical protein ABSA32_15665, partial [Candidatus Acidiferrales bacterium]